MTVPMLATVVVLPSRGLADEISSRSSGFSVAMKSRFVRMDRHDSATDDFGKSCTNVSRFHASPRAGPRLVRRVEVVGRIDGMMPRKVSANSRSSDSFVFTVWSSDSSSTGTAMPSARASSAARASIVMRLGRCGSSGTWAASSSTTLLWCEFRVISTSFRRRSIIAKISRLPSTSRTSAAYWTS